MQATPLSKATFEGRKTFHPCQPINVSGKIPQSQYLSKAFQADIPHYLCSRNEPGIHFPEDPSNIVVLQLGSRWLHFGRSTDALPHSWPMAVATKNNCSHFNGENTASPISSSLAKVPINFKISAEQRKLNKATKPQTMSSINDSYAIEWTPEPMDDNGIQILTGPSILHLKEHWSLFYPIRRGKIVDFTMLEIIIKKSLSQVLELKECKDLSLVIVLDDDLDQQETIASICRLFLEKMSFLSINIIPSSISSCIGSNSGSALVFDFGAQKSSISVVEDCQIIQKKNILIGGDDLNEVLSVLLKDSGGSLQLQPHKRWIHWEIIEALRESVALFYPQEENMPSALTTTTRHEVFERDPSLSETLIHNIHLKDEPLFLGDFFFQTPSPTPKHFLPNPMVIDSIGLGVVNGGDNSGSGTTDSPPSNSAEINSIENLEKEFSFTCKDCASFDSSCFNASLKHILKEHFNGMICTYSTCQKSFPSLLSKKCHIVNHLLNANADDVIVGDVVDGDSGNVENGNENENVENITDALVDLIKELEYSSEDALNNNYTEEKKDHDEKVANERLTKLLSCIILTGGLSKSAGIKERIASIIWGINPAFEIKFSSSDLLLDPSMISWKGGSVLARMDVSVKSGEGWISSKDWSMCGTRVLRERLPFQLK